MQLRAWSKVTVRRSVGLTCCFTVYFHKRLEHLAHRLLSSPALVHNASHLCQLQHPADPFTYLGENWCILSLVSFSVRRWTVSVHWESNKHLSAREEVGVCSQRGKVENSLMFVFWNYILSIFDLPWCKPLGHVHCMLFAGLVLKEYKVSSHYLLYCGLQGGKKGSPFQVT